MSTGKADRPAFPSTRDTTEWREGISIRDYFAAKAMQGITTHYGTRTDYDDRAKESYKIADAMLKAREE